MFRRLKIWLQSRNAVRKAKSNPVLRTTGAHVSPRPGPQMAPRRKPEDVSADENLKPHIESNGPGKNVLVGSKFTREDTGTHEMLIILDDSLIETDDGVDIDPYNTGGFDRAKNWDRRFGK